MVPEQQKETVTTPLSTIFYNYIPAISFIDGGNWIIRRKLPNFIT
jgi:hypothetical protein